MTTATAPSQASPRTVPGQARVGGAVMPSRDEVIDGLALVALTMIGVVGFRDAYGGSGYLIAGVAGVILGLLLSHVGQRVRIPLLGVIAVAVLALILLGGAVSQEGAGSGSIPTPATMHAILTVSFAGWKQLLTTAQPVGSASHLLVLPYLLGLASGVTGHALARRTRFVLLPTAPPAGVVALSILFGSAHASAAIVQGAGFAAISLAWSAARQSRHSERTGSIGRQRPWQRLGMGAAVLAVAVGGAVVIGPRLPGASAHQRVVLRTVPPFTSLDYPSPLASFRDYTNAAMPSVSLYGKELLSVTGLPAAGQQGQQLVRIATMDEYDGTTWGVANAQASLDTFAGFQRVGATLPGASDPGQPAGPEVSGTITLGPGYQGPWLPDLPGTTGLRFGPAGASAQATMRFNVKTGTGVVPDMKLAELRYTVIAAAAAPWATSLPNATPSPATDTEITPVAEVVSFANQHEGAGSKMQQVLRLAGYLKDNGHYSDGGNGQAVLAGQGAGRLTSFLQSDMTGDDEQYAAAMALLANAVGVPARVALDGYVEANGSVHGSDVHADVLLYLDQYGWVTLGYQSFIGHQKPAPPPQRKPQPAPAKAVPQQQPIAAPVTGNGESAASSRAVPPQPKKGAFHLPAIVVTLLEDIGIPVAALVAIAGGLGGAKALRRRRRQRGAPLAAVAGAWRELTDLGRDLGIAPRLSLTRREQASEYQTRLPGAPDLALLADAAIFGPGNPEPHVVDRAWKLVRKARRQALAKLPRWRRAWVVISPVSLWQGLSARALARQLITAGGGGRRGRGTRSRRAPLRPLPQGGGR